MSSPLTRPRGPWNLDTASWQPRRSDSSPSTDDNEIGSSSSLAPDGYTSSRRSRTPATPPDNPINPLSIALSCGTSHPNMDGEVVQVSLPENISASGKAEAWRYAQHPSTSPSSSDSIHSTSSRSRNDIFTSSSPSVAPAPRISSNGWSGRWQSPRTEVGGGGPGTLEASRRSSQILDNDASLSCSAKLPTEKLSSSGDLRPSQLLSPTPRQSGPSTDQLVPQVLISPARSPTRFRSHSSSHSPPVLSASNSSGDVAAQAQRPTLGRQTSAETAAERARIQQTSDVDFRLWPTKDSVLGEGRHCTVYLGSYRQRSKGRKLEGGERDIEMEEQERIWRLCAIKRLHPDRQSQLLGLDETFALRRLGPHPNIVSLIDIRDEVELPSTPDERERADSDSHSQTAGEDFQENAEDGKASQTALSQSASDAAGSRTSRTPTGPPRLLILLELLPYSLASFAKRRKEEVNLETWLRWGIDLTGTLQWLHSKGCVHADIKKENILLTEDLTIKLCDFNSALFPNPSSPPTDGLGLGTPAYSAPELTRSFASGSTFSYKIDIWSLGAVLYSLATGVEPFARARSMTDILHRKRAFLQTEEDDRTARLSIANGWGRHAPGSGSYGARSWNGSSGAGSNNASRSGSLRNKDRRGRLEDAIVALNGGETTSSTPRNKFYSRHEGSTDSIDSVASSVTNVAGRAPSGNVLDVLLDPDSEHIGLLKVASGLNHARSVSHLSGKNDHHRTASLGSAAALGARKMHYSEKGANDLNVPATADRLPPHPPVNHPSQTLQRPGGALRRTTSYGGAHDHEDAPVAMPATASAGPGSPASSTLQPSSLRQEGSTSNLRIALTAAFASASRAAAEQRTASDSTPLSISVGNGAAPEPERSVKQLYDSPIRSPTHQWDCLVHARSASIDSDSSLLSDPSGARLELLEGEEVDQRSYRDGTPALILPGGGRLPDEARDLLARMLENDPKKRPDAGECMDRLNALLLRI